MRTVMVASSREGAGKTGIILGLAKMIESGRIGYLKPMGDRLVYRKKKLWDHDCVLMNLELDMDGDPGDMTIGFDHSKLRFMYDEEGMDGKLRRMISEVGGGMDVMFIEGGKNLSYGASVHLDALKVARSLNARLLLVVSGDEDEIMDRIHFMKRVVLTSELSFEGLVFNKVKDPEDFRNTYLDPIEDMGMKVLGIIPYIRELNTFTIIQLADLLFAKVLAGEKGLANPVKNSFVGVMSAHAALRNPTFTSGETVVITRGDRNDIILAALDSGTAGVILTDNIFPSDKIISLAAQRGVPLLLVFSELFETVKRITTAQPLLQHSDRERIELLCDSIERNIIVGDLFENIDRTEKEDRI